jgi:hypothetical protein
VARGSAAGGCRRGPRPSRGRPSSSSPPSSLAPPSSTTSTSLTWFVPTALAPHCTLHTAHCTLHTAHCTLHTAHHLFDTMSTPDHPSLPFFYSFPRSCRPFHLWRVPPPAAAAKKAELRMAGHCMQERRLGMGVVRGRPSAPFFLF